MSSRSRRSLLRRTALVLAGTLSTAAVMAATSAPAAPARSIEGHAYDATVELAGQKLVLNGVGVRAVAWFKGYTAGLYLAERADTAERAVAMPGAKRLQLRLLQDVPAAEFVKAIERGIARNVPAEQQPALASRRDAFAARVQALGTVRKGDVVDLDFLPGRGLVFSVDGRPRGEPIPGDDFYAAVLLIFLGPKPSDTRLRAGLLGVATN